jgi:signal transduction histidine kinase
VSPSFDITSITLDALPEGVLLVDSDGCIQFLNKAGQAMLGWDIDAIAEKAAEGGTAHDLFCRHSIYTHHEAEECPLAKQGEAQLAPQECYWTHKNSENIAVSYRRSYTDDGSCMILFTTCEQQGFQLEELKKLSFFTEINPSPLLELDDQGLILFSNPAMTDLMLEFGFDDEGAPAILPRDLAALVGKAIEQGGLENIESSANAEENNDKTSHFLWSFHISDGSQGSAVLLSGLDVTSNKEMELQRQEFERSLELEKERTRKEYLAMMVHELRSPLNAVVGYAGILKSKLSSQCSETQLSLFDRIIGGGQQLAEQISTTLDSTRVEAGKLAADISRFNAVPALEEACVQGETLAKKKGLDFRSEISDSDIYALADRQHFKQIAINLISNAIKYTQAGAIEVSLRPSFDEQVGKCVTLEVNDTGCGVPQGQRESIFKLYQRQDSHENSEIEGDGYGLAICCEMLALNHGRIVLDSEVGRGSSFSAIFPR